MKKILTDEQMYNYHSRFFPDCSVGIVGTKTCDSLEAITSSPILREKVVGILHVSGAESCKGPTGMELQVIRHKPEDKNNSFRRDVYPIGGRPRIFMNLHKSSFDGHKLEKIPEEIKM